MPDNIALVTKSHLFEHLHKSLNALLRDTSPGSKHPPTGNEPLDFKKVSQADAVFIKKLCVFLHKECGTGVAGDASDTVQRIANMGSEEAMQQYLLVHPKFLEELIQSLENKSINNYILWSEEKTQPEKMIRLFDMFSEYLTALEPRMKALLLSSSVTPWERRVYDACVDLFKDVPERNTLFKATYNPEHETGRMTRYNQRLEKVENIPHDTRAKVIYFGGKIQASETEDFINRIARRIKRALEPTHISMKDYDVYVATYNNRASISKTQYMYAYNQDPEHFSSPNAKDMVDVFLYPLYAADNGQKLSDEELFRQMSLVTFVGYSYGNAFIQEVRNALVVAMDKMGYEPETTRKALSMVAAFNFNTVINVVDKHARGDFTQIHSSTDGDPASYLHSNVCELTAGDPNPVLKQFRIASSDHPATKREVRVYTEIPPFKPGAKQESAKHTLSEEGLYTVALHGFGIPTELESFETKPLEDFAGNVALNGLRDAKGNGVTVRVIDKTVTRNNTMGHHVVTNYRIDGLRKDDHQLVLRNNPAAEFVNRTFRAQLKAAIDVSTGAENQRPAAQISQCAADKLLTPEAISEYNNRHHAKKRLLKADVTHHRIRASEPPSSGLE